MATSPQPPESDGRPTIVIYGNCQADAMTAVFGRIPALVERFRVVYVPSYNHPVKSAASVPKGDFATCAILFEQYEQSGGIDRSAFSTSVRAVKFPSLDCNLLWPFNCVNPYNIPEPDLPLGRYPYGDRIIVNCVRKGMPADDIFAYYMKGWDEYKIDMLRLSALEQARIALRDSNSDVKLGSLVTERFRERHLFWTVNHPDAALLAEMTTRMLAAAFPDDPWQKNLDLLQIIVKHFSPVGPLGTLGVPVHPGVAEQLELSWYDSDERYRTGNGRTVSYAEYFREMIDHSVARHALTAGANA